MVLEMEDMFDQRLEYPEKDFPRRYLLFSVDYVSGGVPYTYLPRLENERVQFD